MDVRADSPKVTPNTQAVRRASDQRLVRVRLWTVPLTSHTAYHMAEGKTCDNIETIVVALDTDTGLTGWGEVCPIPHYLPAYARGVAPAITELAPVLLNADPVGAEVLMAKLDAWLPGHRYAKSAIDIALWDLTAQIAGLPLHRLLGGRHTEDLAVYHSITCIDPDEMARIAREALQSGVRQIQVKLGADANWEADVARLQKVREAVGDGPLVYGDWNCGASTLEASRVGRAVRDLDIMLEQPCKTIEECARVREATNLPMKLDENAHDTGSILRGHTAGCMDVAAIKLSKFGGLSKARQARDLCCALGVKMCIEDTWGSDIATAAALHLGVATDPRAVLNACDLSGYVTPRLDPNAPLRNAGRIAPPEGPGLGVVPDLDALGAPDMVLD
ncbi:MAG: mandelate racemase [Litoreibacter sp.]|nr:mandelate racemase [Litoreibacter sp.]